MKKVKQKKKKSGRTLPLEWGGFDGKISRKRLLRRGEAIESDRKNSIRTAVYTATSQQASTKRMFG